MYGARASRYPVWPSLLPEGHCGSLGNLLPEQGSLCGCCRVWVQTGNVCWRGGSAPVSFPWCPSSCPSLLCSWPQPATMQGLTGTPCCSPSSSSGVRGSKGTWKEPSPEEEKGIPCLP